MSFKPAPMPSLGFISSERPDMSTFESQMMRNALRIALVKAELSFTAVEGLYQGQVEPSYMVLLDTPEAEAKLVLLGQRFEQESVLISHGTQYGRFTKRDRNYLIDCKSLMHTQLPGELKAVGAIDNIDNATRIDNQYFAIV